MTASGLFLCHWLFRPFARCVSLKLLPGVLQLKDLVAELFPTKDYDAQAAAAAKAAAPVEEGACAMAAQQQQGGANKRKKGLGVGDDEEDGEQGGRKSPSPSSAASEAAAPGPSEAASPALADEGMLASYLHSACSRPSTSATALFYGTAMGQCTDAGRWVSARV